MRLAAACVGIAALGSVGGCAKKDPGGVTLDGAALDTSSDFVFDRFITDQVFEDPGPQDGPLPDGGGDVGQADAPPEAVGADARVDSAPMLTCSLVKQDCRDANRSCYPHQATAGMTVCEYPGLGPEGSI